MSIFKDYIAYLRNNPKGYWFKRKGFGWGWTPVTWQGWLITLGAIVLIVWNAYRLDVEANPDSLVTFLVQTVIVVAVLMWVCFNKGESPKWQWGLPKDDEEAS